MEYRRSETLRSSELVGKSHFRGSPSFGIFPMNYLGKSVVDAILVFPSWGGELTSPALVWSFFKTGVTRGQTSHDTWLTFDPNSFSNTTSLTFIADNPALLTFFRLLQTRLKTRTAVLKKRTRLFNADLNRTDTVYLSHVIFKYEGSVDILP